MNVSSNTQLYMVIGDPVEHSLSPMLHNFAFQSLGINSVYLAFRVKSEDLKSVVAGIKGLSISGFNVTIPHKVSIMTYLDEIDSVADQIGAVNTVINRKGILVGYNTDGIGALAALREEGVNLNQRKVVLLGAGGAAKALAFLIAPLTERLVILNRTASKANDLAFFLKKRGLIIEAKELTDAVLCKELIDTDVLINATPIGMFPKIDKTLVKREYLRPGMTVFDIVYNPLMTRLLIEAKAAGAHILGGLKMLLYQGAFAFELWTGRTPPVDQMYNVVERVLRRE